MNKKPKQGKHFQVARNAEASDYRRRMSAFAHIAQPVSVVCPNTLVGPSCHFAPAPSRKYERFQYEATWPRPSSRSFLLLGPESGEQASNLLNRSKRGG